jgi:tRNA pseudouridine65 synthase
LQLIKKWIVGPQSFYARDAKVYAIQELRNQIGQHVYPVHRLDRKTSGVLLFALDRMF